MLTTHSYLIKHTSTVLCNFRKTKNLGLTWRFSTFKDSRNIHNAKQQQLRNSGQSLPSDILLLLRQYRNNWSLFSDRFFSVLSRQRVRWRNAFTHHLTFPDDGKHCIQERPVRFHTNQCFLRSYHYFSYTSVSLYTLFTSFGVSSCQQWPSPFSCQCMGECDCSRCECCVGTASQWQDLT